MTELWLVRHGETEWSVEGRHTGRTDLPLTERGRERAVVLGRYLAETKFKAVLCSPMIRAKETCDIAGFGSVAVMDEGLQEWDYGVYEGRTSQEIQVEIPGWSVWKDPIFGGESLEHVGARADGVIARAQIDAGPPTDEVSRVALFAHAHILRILAARWLGLAPFDGSFFVLGTGSVSLGMLLLLMPETFVPTE